MGGNDFVAVWDWIKSYIFIDTIEYDDEEWELLKTTTPIRPYIDETFDEYEERIKERQKVIDRITKNQEKRRKKRKLPQTPKIKIPNPHFKDNQSLNY